MREAIPYRRGYNRTSAALHDSGTLYRQTGLRATPSPMSADSDYFENPIQVDKGRLGKLE